MKALTIILAMSFIVSCEQKPTQNDINLRLFEFIKTNSEQITELSQRVKQNEDLTRFKDSLNHEQFILIRDRIMQIQYYIKEQP